MKKSLKKFLTALFLFALFAVFTLAVKTVDVQAIGPNGSEVGFAGINSFFFNLLGTNDLCYKLTKLLGYLSFLVAGLFALKGLVQLVRKKSLRKVDYRLLLLACTYVLMLVFYVLFEKLVINCRPVILDEAEGLEASYPSSHTMLLLCIMGTAYMLLPRYLNGVLAFVGRVICVLMMIAMPVGRLLSGVHWFTDIVGSILLSSALIALYGASVSFVAHKRKRKKKKHRQHA